MTYQEYKEALKKINDQKTEVYANTKNEYCRIGNAYMNGLLTAREALDLFNEAEQTVSRRIKELNEAIDAIPV